MLYEFARAQSRIIACFQKGKCCAQPARGCARAGRIGFAGVPATGEPCRSVRRAARYVGRWLHTGAIGRDEGIIWRYFMGAGSHGCAGDRAALLRWHGALWRASREIVTGLRGEACRCAVDIGRGAEIHLSRRRSRRGVGRSCSAGFYRNKTAGDAGGKMRHPCHPHPLWRQRQPVCRAAQVAYHHPSIHHASTRHQGARHGLLAGRTVSRPVRAAWHMAGGL